MVVMVGGGGGGEEGGLPGLGTEIDCTDFILFNIQEQK